MDLWYAKRKAAGLCAICGKVPPEEGRVACRECALKRAEELKEYRDAHREELNQKAREKRHARQALGLCIRCGEPADSGNLCPRCSQDQRGGQKWRRQAYIRTGRCGSCGKEDAFTMAGKGICAECAERRNQSSKAWNLAHPGRKAESRRKLSEQRQAAGLCTMCGKPLPKNYRYKNCQTCLAKIRNRRQPVYIPNGMCHRCKKEPCVEGKKLCAACYEVACRSAEKARACMSTEGHVWRQMDHAMYEAMKK